MTKQRLPFEAGEARWAFGCAFPAVIALLCATAGTVLEIRLVMWGRGFCAGDLGSGEKFAGLVGGVFWSLGRILLFPVVSVCSAVLSVPVLMLARTWPIKGSIGLELVVLTLVVAISFAGPVALAVHDYHAIGACALPSFLR
ncbi:hypothetical protein [Nonomuraea typhae]|uniref:hypothetical protein n=1 Tax=Nonomuraea typhae TaxID=2603600 RepID=UPI0012F89BFA|nr:hypothetical protein [Nonomuraea typhae]